MRNLILQLWIGRMHAPRHNITKKYFEITSIKVEYNSGNVLRFATSNMVYDKHLNLKDYFGQVFKKENFDLIISNSIICCKGKIKVEEDIEIDYELFKIRINRANNIGISINTNNYAFLPHHPIYKKRQYEIWKLNAPRLAKSLQQFNEATHFNLLTEPGEIGKLANISSVIYYLQNAPIVGVEEDGWDEFFIPFDLL